MPVFLKTDTEQQTKRTKKELAMPEIQTTSVLK